MVTKYRFVHYVLPFRKNVHYPLRSRIEKNRLLLKNVHYNQIKEEDSKPIIGSDSSFIYCLTPLPFSFVGEHKQTTGSYN